MRPSLLIGEKTHQEFHEFLRGRRCLTVSGASNETAKAMLLAHLLSNSKTSAVLVTETSASAEGLAHWLRFFEHPAILLSPIECPDGSVDPGMLREFVTFVRTDGIPHVLILTQDLWGQALPSFTQLHDQSIVLKRRETIQFTELFEQLLGRGYTHGEDLVLRPGEYRRTGDTFDIFPIQSQNPYRVSLEFDIVDRIYRVDSGDLSRTEDAGEELEIFPVSFTERALLSAQISEDTLLVLDDLEDADSKSPAPLADRSIGRQPILRFTAFPETPEQHVHVRYLSVLKFYTLSDFLNDLRDKMQQGWRIVIVTKRAKELESILKEERISAGVIVVPAAEEDLLPHSLQNPDLKCALLTDREIFTLRKTGKERSVAKLALDFITSLQPGDYVVHMDHGIGHFEGMTQKEIDGIAREYLELTYAHGDKLFVPVDQADKLSKFVHEEGQVPVLTRLGTVEWKRVTEKMHAETKAIAKELLDLYALRARAKGHCFEGNVDLERTFGEAFPYQETPGQLKAIVDLTADMESDRPMDRLICGDVGFGKTEVAMRAAYKAVVSGKQVAVVAPITILADQHYHTFLSRFAKFPARMGTERMVRIEMLSRFRSPKEQKKIIDRLRKGDLDVVIGTHRLLQPDVKFFNLGLVIVDEEQRFGVKQKERFKEMRANIDLLTLTATPIPRTLNLGLHKLRDITTITTPPPGRLPIITEVRKFSDQLVREAVLNEKNRGGQCFVLHNRVETIDAFCEKLRALIPEASFVVGHGQLTSDELEDRIVAFKEGRYDVLVSSTIIENGIDLPRANTLVVNEAERFGVAQLYQLRGRVGRSKVQAYAYLLYHTHKLSEDARKRLRAIVEACELGSGFQVAMRDLEIRGAGEILGASQSGAMQTVGVSHFLRMLKRAVEDLKGEGQGEREEPPVEIQLPVEAFIPNFYITDHEEKISVYQKLAGSEDESILAEFLSDLREEYGELPQPVQNLFAILRLKMACRAAGVQRVQADDRDMIVFHLAPRVTAKEIMQLVGRHHDWKISGSTLRAPEKTFHDRAKGADWLGVLREDVLLLNQ